ncbi:oxidoreductase [Bordetella pertussis]|nr:oxidoreductase [Bordetella pertussis]
MFYGWEPQADFADSLGLERDSRGYLRTDFATAQTSLPDVYAMTAAKAIQRRWERPAPPR